MSDIPIGFFDSDDEPIDESVPDFTPEEEDMIDSLSDEIPDFLFSGERFEDQHTEDYFKVPSEKTDLSVCNTEYVLSRGIPIVVMFCRDPLGNDYVIPDKKFRPYFYIENRDLIKFVDKNLLHSATNQVGLIPKYTDMIFGLGTDQPLVQLFTNKPNDVAKYRSAVKGIRTWEADILYPNRYLIDKGIKSGITYIPSQDPQIIPNNNLPSKYKKLYVDIETFSWKNPDPKNTPDEVIIIGTYDDNSETYVIFSTKSIRAEDLEPYLKIKKPITIMTFGKEDEMFRKFIDYVETIRPDLFLSFTEFDWLYLVNRMKKIGISYSRLSRVHIVQVMGEGSKIKIHGLQHLDLQEMYFRVFLSGSKWETLHGIAWKELGEEKLYREESVYENWLHKPDHVFIRNLRDTEIIVRLDRELSLTDYFDAIKKIIGGNFADTVHNSRIADMMYLRLCNGKKVLPTKTFKTKVAYQGAIVFPVKPGVYRNIVVFDWSSMYPSIIKSFNMSFDTWATYVATKDSDRFYNIDNKYYFTKEPIGYTVQLLNELEPIRTPYKKRSRDPNLTKEERNYNKAVSDGIKAIINSIYGVFGQAGDQVTIKSYRIYLPDIAAATTYVGRTLELEGLKPVCESIGYNIIYADTDSVFIQLKTDNPEEEIKYLERLLTEKMAEFVHKRWNVDSKGLSLSFDKLYRNLIMFVKKRYIGITSENEQIVKGLEIVRRNTADVSGEAQEKISKAIFSDKTRDEIIVLCKELVSDFYKRPLEEIAIAQNVTKNAYYYKTFASHLKSFLWSCSELKLNLVENKRFWTVYIKTDQIPSKYSRTIDSIYFPEGFPEKLVKRTAIVNSVAWDELNPLPQDIIDIIDMDKMLKVTLQDKLEPFLELLKIRWFEDILGKLNPKTQKKLDSFDKKLNKFTIKHYIISEEARKQIVYNDFMCMFDPKLKCPCKDIKNCKAKIVYLSPKQTTLT